MSGLEPLALIGIASTVGGTALQAGGQMMRGREEARAARFEQQQLEQQAQMTRTAASQAEARRREELTSSLETITAIRAGRGVGATSPTGMAVYENLIERGERDIATERLSLLSRADQARMASEMAGRRARYSLIAGDIEAGATVLGGIGRAGRLYG